MNKKIISFFAIILVIIAYTNVVSIGASIDELNEQKEQAQNEKDKVTEQKENAQDELEEINSQIAGIQNEIDTLESKLYDLNTSINQKHTEIEEKQKELEHKEDLLKDRMVAMYKNGGTSYLDILLGSSNYIDMFTKYNAVKTIAEKDTELINEVSSQKEVIENEKKSLEDTKKEVENTKKEKDAKSALLNASKVAKQDVVSKLSQEEQKLQKTIDEFEDKITEAQDDIRNNTIGSYEGSFKGVLEWPLSYSYNRITSIFGNRTAPTAGASSNHGAIDIGVSYVPVYAPADGKVILASWISGYGNYIKIDHGNGYYTAFGHLSQYKVSVGSVVK